MTSPASRTPAKSAKGGDRPYAPRLPTPERRTQLLNAALDIIVRDGYAGVTIEAIAAEAGVTRPVVYGMYAGLSELLIDLLDRTQAAVLTQLLDAISGSDSGGRSRSQVITGVSLAWTRAVREHPIVWTPILLTGAKTPRVVLERIEEGRELLRRAVAKELRAGSSAPPDHVRRAELAARAVVATAEDFGALILTDPEYVDDEELAALFVDLITALGTGPAHS